MTLFWLIAALMMTGALAWLLPVLLSKHVRSDPGAVSHTDHAIASYSERLDGLEQDFADGVLSEEQLENARQELARELLQDVRPDDPPARAADSTSAWVVAVLIPVVAVGLYSELGQPEGLGISGPGPRQAQAAPGTPVAGGGSAGTATAAGAEGLPSIEQMVTGLAERLQREPNDGEGWLMLGRSYVVLERMDDAEQAYAKAYALLPQNVDVLAGYAESLARNNRNSLAGKPAALLAQALSIKTDDPKTLWLSGIAAMQRGDGPSAVAHWNNLKSTGALNAQETASLDQMIAEAGGQAATPATPVAATSGVSVKVKVTLDPSLSARVATGDALFVFARAAQGPPMPLAVQRLVAGALPLEVTLDESMAMIPNMTLASFPRVVVGARISKSGNARPSDGDLQGLSEAIDPKSVGRVAVQISDVVGEAPTGIKAAPAQPAAAPAQPAAADGVAVNVTVNLDPALASRIAPGDALFVFARAEQGPPMPLAVTRLSAAELPLKIMLDESMAMMPNMTLASFPRVVIGARISKTGNARPSDGDLQGISRGINPKSTNAVSVTISEVVGQ